MVTHTYMPMQVQRGCRSAALPIFNLHAQSEWVASGKPQLLYPWERVVVPIIEDTWWAPSQSGLEKRKSLSPSRVQSPDCPAHGESLYQLRYLSPALLLFLLLLLLSSSS
jgi:hypothetical protein